MKYLRLFFIFLLAVQSPELWASTALSSGFHGDITYSGENTPDNPRKLDVYLPQHHKQPLTALIWLHGGGLTAGSKDEKVNRAFAEFWQSQGIAVMNVNYRLSPQVHFPAYIEDAAAAIHWTLEHATSLGLDTHKIYVGGHSAGAYLTSILALDEHFLRAQQVEPTQLAGFISLSGQMSTHFTVRQEQGLDDTALLVTPAAPFYHIKQHTPRLLLLIGDNDWPARLEENQLAFAQFTKVAKNSQVQYQVIAERTHTSIFEKISEKDTTYLAIHQFMNL